jgi:hypothetical protein
MAIRVTPNAEQIPLNLVGSSTFGRYPKISLEKTYNMFESDGWMVDFPGYKKVLEILSSGVEGRALYRSFRGNFLIAVIDGNVYRISSGLNVTPTLIGTLATYTGEVFIDENLNSQVCLVDGLNAYIYNYSPTGGSITIQTQGALGSGDLIPNYVTYHNTYFLFGNANKTQQGAAWYAYIENNANLNEIIQEDMLALQTKPDHALAIKRIPGQSANVLVMGGSVCEIHTQVGGSTSTGVGFLYQRNSSFSSDYGVLSVSTIAESDIHILWLGVNEDNAPAIMMFTGNSVKRISTDGIDYLLDSLHRPDLSTAMMYRVDGHLFYHITFYYVVPGRPDLSDNLSLVYDVDNDKFYHISDQDLNYHPARQVVYFNQQLYFISLNGGAIYQMGTDITFINEDISDGVYETDPNLAYEIQRIRICKNIRFPTSAPFKANQVCITIEQGCDEVPPIQECLVLMITENNIRMFSEKGGPSQPAYPDGPGLQLVPERHGQEDCESVPYRARVDLALSRDGGMTFGNYVARRLHTTGYRKNILNWDKMGSANDLTLKFRFWSLGRFVVFDGIVDVTP